MREILTAVSKGIGYFSKVLDLRTELNKKQALIHVNCLKIIVQYVWPPSSPDLIPLDYFVWNSIEVKVNGKRHRSLDSHRHLKRFVSKLDICI